MNKHLERKNIFNLNTYYKERHINQLAIFFSFLDAFCYKIYLKEKNTNNLTSFIKYLYTYKLKQV